MNDSLVQMLANNSDRYAVCYLANNAIVGVSITRVEIVNDKNSQPAVHLYFNDNHFISVQDRAEYGSESSITATHNLEALVGSVITGYNIQTTFNYNEDNRESIADNEIVLTIENGYASINIQTITSTEDNYSEDVGMLLVRDNRS